MSEPTARDGAPERPDVFISYASNDLGRAERLLSRLTADGFSVWFDKSRLEPGCQWQAEIEAACESTRVMLPLITPNWSSSEWTRYETYIHAAIIPVLAEGDPKETLPPPLRRLNGIALDPLAADEGHWQALFTAIRTKLAEPLPEREPRLLDLPYQANPFFTGRERDLDCVHELLHTAPAAVLTQSKVSALAAMGGMGKTTLANEYARRYWRLYPQILWVDARRGYQAEFARQFDRLFPKRAHVGLEPEEKALEAVAELNGGTERLLVIDNAEDAKSVLPWLPRAPASGCRTLITSRFTDWPQAEGIRKIQLNTLGPSPSVAFLVNRTGRVAEGHERIACEALAKALDYLPLALEQAAAYIKAPGAGVSFSDYLRLFEAATADLLSRGALGSTEYPDPVIATWQTTVAKLSPESRAVLALCAWLASTPIPRRLVVEGAADVLALAVHWGSVAPLGTSAIQAELRMIDALTGLARYSMILDVTEESFRVHGLVQTVERIQALNEGHDVEGRDRALARLTALFPKAQDPSVWPLCRQLMPHESILVDRVGPDCANAGLTILLNQASAFLMESGEPWSALPLCSRALEGSERVLGQDHPLTLSTVSNLANCRLEMGDALSALPLLRRALKGCERVLGQDHPLTLSILNNLAFCLLELNIPPFLPLFQRALQSRERVLGQDHPETLNSLNNLGYCLHRMGYASAAFSRFRRALERCERVLGQDHPETLSSLNNLAQCLQTLDFAPAALPLLRRALERCERVLGEDHPETLDGLNNLAGCLETLDEASSALPLFRRALRGCEEGMGEHHPITMTVRSNLTRCERLLGGDREEIGNRS